MESENEQHYSDLTIAALINTHGWKPGYQAEEKMHLINVTCEFSDVGYVGGSVVPDGTRRLYAGYSHDSERRRYISLAIADKEIKDWDGRGQDPATIARQVNEAAAKYADENRVKNGLSAIYHTANISTVTSDSDLSYTQSTDALFITFYPNTSEGEKAWKVMNSTPGAQGGKVLAAHIDSTIEQLRKAGYTVSQAAITSINIQHDDALLQELINQPKKINT